MGRGSIGDVTFYRGNGQQLSRVRNRKPYNPKTNAQLYQRAIMATIVKAYQAGKEIFDHSFEGVRVGAENQREFLSRNIKMLRGVVGSDINTPVLEVEQLGRVVAPGVNSPVPNSYIISRGSYPQRLFKISSGSQAAWQVEPVQNLGEGNQPVYEYAADNGLIAGDIYTLVMFVIRNNFVYQHPDTTSNLAGQRDCSFAFVRMIVKDGLDSVSDRLNTIDQLFDFNASPGLGDIIVRNIQSTEPGTLVNFETMLTGADGYENMGAMGVIRSRLDQDLRSDSEMVVDYTNAGGDLYGIASAYLLDVWARDNTKIGSSSLILEGGDI